LVQIKDKYLVILAGSPRGGEKTWDSLYKYVIKHLDADLAICTGDNFYVETSLTSNAKYKWIFNEPKNWSDYYSNHYSNKWKDYLILGKEYGMAGGIDDNSGSGAIVSALKDIIYQNYLPTLENYDYIIYSRFDQMYTDYHPKFTGDNLWIPEGEDYLGICDRHIIFPSKYAKSYFNVCEYFDSNNAYENAPKLVTPESVFLEHLHSESLSKKIQRIKRFQFTVALKKDSTRWRVAKYKIHFYHHLMMKYPDEFIASIANLIHEYGLIRSGLKKPAFILNYYYLKIRRSLGDLKKKFSIKD